MQTTPALRSLDTYLLSFIGKQARTRLTTRGVLLRHHGILAYLADQGPSSQRDIGSALSYDPSDMVKALDELGPRIRRDRDPADRRRQLVSITATGTKALKSMTHQAESVADEVLAALTPAQRATLTRLLQLTLDSL